MNQGQEMFYKFFMERVMDEKKEDAKKVLEECFEKQNRGQFDRSSFDAALPRLQSAIKPEAMEEVQKAMDSFASKL